MALFRRSKTDEDIIAEADAVLKRDDTAWAKGLHLIEPILKKASSPPYTATQLSAFLIAAHAYQTLGQPTSSQKYLHLVVEHTTSSSDREEAEEGLLYWAIEERNAAQVWDLIGATQDPQLLIAALPVLAEPGSIAAAKRMLGVAECLARRDDWTSFLTHNRGEVFNLIGWALTVDASRDARVECPSFPALVAFTLAGSVPESLREHFRNADVFEQWFTDALLTQCLRARNIRGIAADFWPRFWRVVESETCFIEVGAAPVISSDTVEALLESTPCSDDWSTTQELQRWLAGFLELLGHPTAADAIRDWAELAELMAWCPQNDLVILERCKRAVMLLCSRNGVAAKRQYEDAHEAAVMLKDEETRLNALGRLATHMAQVTEYFRTQDGDMSHEGGYRRIDELGARVIDSAEDLTARDPTALRNLYRLARLVLTLEPADSLASVVARLKKQGYEHAISNRRTNGSNEDMILRCRDLENTVFFTPESHAQFGQHRTNSTLLLREDMREYLPPDLYARFQQHDAFDGGSPL